MARPNYSGEKRRKELEKQKKKEAKKQRKLENAANPASADDTAKGEEETPALVRQQPLPGSPAALPADGV